MILSGQKKKRANADIQHQIIALMPRIRRFAFSLTGSWDKADDLLQASCERALQEIDKWTPGTKLDAWMFRISRNLFLNTIRADKVRQTGLHSNLPDNKSPLAVIYHDGQKQADNQLLLQQIEKLLGEMPEDQRTALVMVCVEGYSYRETSEIMGLPQGTIASKVARAREFLSESLEPTAALSKQQDKS